MKNIVLLSLKMSKTFKDKPKAYKPKENRKPKEGRRFESSKGRKNPNNLKDLVFKNLEDYFI